MAEENLEEITSNYQSNGGVENTEETYTSDVKIYERYGSYFNFWKELKHFVGVYLNYYFNLRKKKRN